MRFRPPYRPIRPVLFLLLLVACSTEKDTFVHRTYHNTTARYNGYYYADLSVKEGLEKIRKDQEVDYSSILPVFNDGDKESASVAYPEMDRAIEKLSKVIDRHSMDIRGKQKCKWIDDSYLLLGRAYFYKRNFDKAEEMFTYISKKFNRKPIRPLALIWLARTHIENEKLDDARNVLKLIEEDRLLERNERKDLEDLYWEVWAQLYIQQENYEKAAQKLEDAIEKKRWLLDRTRKTRLHYILGQLYHRLDNIDKGNRHYAQVVKLNPPYEMAFQAKIEQALAYREGVKNPEGIKEQLLDMLDDDKNIDYYDQIYYALAEIELQQGNREQGIHYLEKSTDTEEASKPEQRTKAYLKLADLHFEDQAFSEAQGYYDTTYKRIEKEHPRYLDIERKANSLNELVEALNTIEEKDSLLRMAEMDKGERRKRIEEMIDKRVEKAKDRKQEMRVSEQELREQNAFASGSNNSGSTFYFYNQKAKSQGYNTFKQRWGDRSLEDDWRRSSSSEGKSEQVFSDPAAADSLKSEEGVITDPSYYEKELPLEEEEKEETRGTIAQAMYDAGMIYREDLENEAKAIEMFRSIVDRFDIPSYTPPAYYQLYRIYLRKEEQDNYYSMDKTKSSQHYKELILDRYPESDYAKLIRDPEGLEEDKEKRKAVKAHYEATLQAYNEGKLLQVMTRSDSALSNGTGDEFRPKYMLLKGLSLGRSDSLSAAKEMLKKVVDEHSGSPESERAEQILKGLNQGGGSTTPEIDIKDSPFEKANDATHYFCIALPKNAGDPTEVQNGISDFNSEYFSKKSLKVNSTFLRNKDNLIIVKKFSDRSEGMDYYRTFLQRSSVLQKIDLKKAKVFIIAQNNFGIMFKEEKSEAYMAFFKKVYLEKEG